SGVVVFFVGLQIFLGIGALLVTPQSALSGSVPPDSMADLVRSSHVANGAMILAMCLVVTARSFKLLTPSAGEPAAERSANSAPESTGTLHREAHA
ncbi:MAG TPA: hypothetical protein VL860_15625, partial [Planctomycetota bacterium]|nr:hypothetical protein [Planctomycetota bacterium]